MRLASPHHSAPLVSSLNVFKAGSYIDCSNDNSGFISFSYLFLAFANTSAFATLAFCSSISLSYNFSAFLIALPLNSFTTPISFIASSVSVIIES